MVIKAKRRCKIWEDYLFYITDHEIQKLSTSDVGLLLNVSVDLQNNVNLPLNKNEVVGHMDDLRIQFLCLLITVLFMSF